MNIRRRSMTNALAAACFGLAASAFIAPASAQAPVDQQGRAQYDKILASTSARGAVTGVPPIVRIVSPLADTTLAVGASRPGAGSLNGSGFVVNLEVVTRDTKLIQLREATLAPPVFGIRNVPQLNLGIVNPDAPRMFVFFDVPLLDPNGGTFPAFHNFASAFNVAGTDDTPGPGVTAWLGWHVLESFPAGVKEATLTVAFTDDAGRTGFDQIKLKIDGGRVSGQSLTPPPETYAGASGAEDGPEVSLIAPRVPTSIAVGPTGSTLTANNGSLFFIHLSAVDRSGAGIALSETGLTTAGAPLNPAIPTGLIFDPIGIPNGANRGGPNRNFPGLNVTFDVPLRQPSGNIVPAGTNLAPLFDIAGSEVDTTGAVRVTSDWVVGGSLVVPPGKKSVTIDAAVTDNAGRTGRTRHVVTVSPTTSGQDLTAAPRL